MALQGDYEPSPSDWAAKQVEGYEASNGTESNTLRGVPVVILHTRGRTSGKVRKSPLMRVEHDGVYAVIASKGGADENPLWYLNLLADANVALQDGPVAEDRIARVVSGDEREQWWQRATAVWPDYDDYQRKTEREIPVVLVEPAQS